MITERTSLVTAITSLAHFNTFAARRDVRVLVPGLAIVSLPSESLNHSLIARIRCWNDVTSACFPALFDRDRTIASPNYSRWLVPYASLAIQLSIGQAYAFRSSLPFHPYRRKDSAPND